MQFPVSWLRSLVEIPAEVGIEDLAWALTMLGLKLEAIVPIGHDLAGSLVVGRVLEINAEKHSNGKTIRWCKVDVGESEPRGIVCGAFNFAVGDLVAVALPGTVLPGGFEIGQRMTYGHPSDGMICSARELGLGDDHIGILVLDASAVVGEDAAEVLGVRDDVIELEINPDRAYALSMRGVARETAIAFPQPFSDPVDAVTPVVDGGGFPVDVSNLHDCRGFTAVTVRGFNPTAPSPAWLARRVQLAGIRPLSLAVDVTNYVMLELGQPLHAYDQDKLTGRIVVRRAEPGEALTTLDGKERELDPEDLLITDESGPIGLAGVMGGEATEITAATSNIVLEAANFDPITIARTARRHKLPSEASRRFERGVDPTIGPAAAVRAARLLVEYGGGELETAATVIGGVPSSRQITIADDLPARVSGIDIGADTVVGALETVGCRVAVSDHQVTAAPAPWRPDLDDPYDLVEEVVRIVGYDKVPSVLPTAPAGTGLTRRQQLRRRVGLVLAGAGYVETLAFPFVSEKDWEALRLPADDERRRTIKIANPLSEIDPQLRTTALPGLLRALGRNLARGQSDLGLFEIGAVFLPPPGERPVAPRLSVDHRPSDDELKQLDVALPDQPLHLGVVISGRRERPGWWGDGRPACWADAIDACRRLGTAVGADVTALAAAHEPWHPGRCAQLVIGDDVIGYAGELHPRACRAYGLPARVAAAELDLDALLAHATAITTAPRLSSFPVGKEDVALVVGRGVPAADVAKALTDGGGELLESVRLFDVYEGEQVGPGRKSLAFSLRFRAPDRTLTEPEISGARDAAVEVAVERLEAVHRV